MLRDPRRRLLSLYYFFRAHTWEHVEQCEKAGVDSPRLAKELDLVTYLRRPDYLVRLYANNAITRHLIGLKCIGLDGQLTLSEDDAFAMAVQNLKSLSAFGVIEHYPRCRKRLSAAVGFDLPEEMEKANDFENFGQNPALEPVERLQNFDAETEEEIQANIRIDNRLYEWAVGRLGK